MNKLSKYILDEIYPIFIISNIFFVFILLFDKVVDLTDLFFSKNVPTIIIIETFIFYLPSFLMVTIPTSALLAVMTAHNRLSADAELVVMKSLGLSPANLLKPTIYFGILATLLAFLTSFYLLPYGNKYAIYNLKRTVEYVSLKDVKENEFYKEIPSITIYVKKKVDEHRFLQVTLIDEKGGSLITASEADAYQKFGAVVFDLKNGSIIQGKNDRYGKIEFKRFYFVVNVDSNLNREIKSERFMFMDELISRLDDGYIYKFEFSKRVALPFSTLIMALLGLNMGVFFHRTNRSINWIIALGIIFSYNVIMFMSENLAGKINPYFAPWIANAIFAFLSLIRIGRVLK
ncbi:MAG: LptF/LptG family permease [Calditerrivibrio sp.]|uniref:LptF/LptG family permease n=1 Tax=Calditerrivibrio sp. TaxID=2792612 RepID=UPI003D0DCA26